MHSGQSDHPDLLFTGGAEMPSTGSMDSMYRMQKLDEMPQFQRYRRASMITLPSDLQRYDPTTQKYYTVHSQLPLAGMLPLTPQRKQSVSKGSAAKIYALRIASTPGIYHSWNTAKALIDGCPGAKYKGFFSVEECMQFFWEQFPGCTFTQQENGDYVMNEPDAVYQIIEEARQKKEKNSGIQLSNDASSFDPNDPQVAELQKLIASHPHLSIKLNEDQRAAFESVKAGSNVFISGGVLQVNCREVLGKMC
jgi:hypothetical protein